GNYEQQKTLHRLVIDSDGVTQHLASAIVEAARQFGCLNSPEAHGGPQKQDRDEDERATDEAYEQCRSFQGSPVYAVEQDKREDKTEDALCDTTQAAQAKFAAGYQDERFHRAQQHAVKVSPANGLIKNIDAG